MITGHSRRALAKALGHPDVSAKIPDARWTRAMIFERLCHDHAFAGEVAARATGWSGFTRPTSVVSVDCGVSVATTAAALVDAVARSVSGAATLLSRLAVPFPGLPEGQATNVLPDLAVVTWGPAGPALIVGDVKDFERVRSVIDDGRLLRGFLQVAMGALAFQHWSQSPAGLTVSTHGFLAVPRSAFLQPTVEVENIQDHLAEIESQIESRLAALGELSTDGVSLDRFVEHLGAAFDPNSCSSCSLFNHCRQELRAALDPAALLIEIGVPTVERTSIEPMLHGQPATPSAKPVTVQRLRATITGIGESTGKLRLDCVDRPGCIDVVAAKSDTAALGFHGLAVRRHTADGVTPWVVATFPDPQSDETRRRVMSLIGNQLDAALGEQRQANPNNPDPVHIVVPDRATADLLASTADLLAGVELSGLRWRRDLEMGRPTLTYNGEPATVPKQLKAPMRRAVSFLLEHDRARMLKLRQPVVNLTEVLADHVIPGGAQVLAGRLDYLVAWTAERPVDHRQVADEIETSPHTPGARLANHTSDLIHAALRGGDPAQYQSLVEAELEYKMACVDAALEALDHIPDSKLQPAYRSLEADAQRIWRRRMELKASDLVRFGRTYAYWRNQLVDVIQSDERCAAQLAVLANPLQAESRATDPGVRELTTATVLSTVPLTLEVASRRFTDQTGAVLLTRRGEGWLETSGAQVKATGGAFQLRFFPQAPLQAILDGDGAPVPGRFLWSPRVDSGLNIGDTIVLANLDWFDPKQTWFNVDRPRQDDQAAPKSTCTDTSYTTDSETHRWCCKPHDLVEADFADDIALRRARGELNPETWPPVRDADGFEVPPVGKPTNRDVPLPVGEAPEGMTIDELE